MLVGGWSMVVSRQASHELPTTTYHLPSTIHYPLSSQLGDPAVELGDRLLQLLLPSVVHRQFELALHLGSCQPERFELPRPFRIGALGRLLGFALFLFAFFH